MPEMWEIIEQMGQEADKYEAWKYANSGNGSGGWHIDALCSRLGFSSDEANIIKSEFTSVFQRMFGGNASLNTPQQFEKGRLMARDGDPRLLTFAFRGARRFYYAIENVPFVNDLKVWAKIDKIVLAKSNNSVVKHFLETLEYSFSQRTA